MDRRAITSTHSAYQTKFISLNQFIRSMECNTELYQEKTGQLQKQIDEMNYLCDKAQFKRT